MDGFRKYNGWHFFISDFLKRPLKVVLGGLLYGWLLRRKEKTHYLVLPGFLGDSMAALSLLGEYKRQNRIEHVTVVGIPGFIRQLCRFYPDCVDGVLYLKKWQIGSLIAFSRSYLGQYLISFPHRERITGTAISV